MPVAVGLMLYYPSAALPEVLAMPEWWPLIKTMSRPEGMQSVYALVGLTPPWLQRFDLHQAPRQKARVTAAMSGCFSLILRPVGSLVHTWLGALACCAVLTRRP